LSNTRKRDIFHPTPQQEAVPT